MTFPTHFETVADESRNESAAGCSVPLIRSAETSGTGNIAERLRAVSRYAAPTPLKGVASCRYRDDSLLG